MISGNTRTNSPDGDLTRYNPILLPALSRNDAAPEPPEPAASRERLKQANSALEAAKAELDNAQVLSCKAVRLHENAKADFSRSQQASHAVLQWKIKTFKSGSTSSLPPDLRDAREEGVFAAENLAHAETLASTMAQELQIAQSNLASTERAKAEAVAECLLEKATELSAELKHLNERRDLLRLLLQGLTLGAGPKLHNIACSMIAAGLQQRDVTLPMNQSPVLKSQSYWKSYAEALALDETVAPGDYPTWETLWS